MSVIIKAKCVREMFRNGDYRILGWSPCGEYEGVNGIKEKIKQFY